MGVWLRQRLQNVGDANPMLKYILKQKGGGGFVPPLPLSSRHCPFTAIASRDGNEEEVATGGSLAATCAILTGAHAPVIIETKLGGRRAARLPPSMHMVNGASGAISPGLLTQ